VSTNPRCLAVLLGLVVVVAGACAGEAEESARSGHSVDALPLTVTAESKSYQPDALEGHATHTIDLTLVNNDGTAHSFTMDDMGVDIEAAAGEEAQVTFTPEETGTFTFYCKYHPDMKGELKVS